GRCSAVKGVIAGSGLAVAASDPDLTMGMSRKIQNSNVNTSMRGIKKRVTLRLGNWIMVLASRQFASEVYVSRPKHDEFDRVRRTRNVNLLGESSGAPHESSECARAVPPSSRIRSRPMSTTQVGRMLIRAMNRPLPVAVI